MVGRIISIYRFEAEVKVALLSWLISKEGFLPIAVIEMYYWEMGCRQIKLL
jgi:hypothetical protein